MKFRYRVFPGRSANGSWLTRNPHPSDPGESWPPTPSDAAVGTAWVVVAAFALAAGIARASAAVTAANAARGFRGDMILGTSSPPDSRGRRPPIVDRVLSSARPVGDVDPRDPHVRGLLFRGTVSAGPPDRLC